MQIMQKTEGDDLKTWFMLKKKKELAKTDLI